MTDAAGLLSACKLGQEQVLTQYGHVVLEGAQGLLLDQDMGSFPHVTRSHTGLRNAGALLASAGIERAEVHYVLRPYVTRHGAGPLPGELAGLPYPGVQDQTNLPNPWQGTLRFAPLDIGRLRDTLARDAEHAQLPPRMRVSRRLAVTCLDQTDGEVRYWERGVQRTASPEEFVQRCLAATACQEALLSYAPHRGGCRTLSARQAVSTRAWPGRRFRQPSRTMPEVCRTAMTCACEVRGCAPDRQSDAYSRQR